MVMEDRVENKTKAQQLLNSCKERESEKMVLRLSPTVVILVKKQKITDKLIEEKRAKYNITHQKREAAKKTGITPSNKIDTDAVQLMLDSGSTMKEIASELNCKEYSIVRAMKNK